MQTHLKLKGQFEFMRVAFSPSLLFLYTKTFRFEMNLNKYCDGKKWKCNSVYNAYLENIEW